MEELYYRIIVAEDTYTLSQRVSEAMQAGWAPTGGVAVSRTVAWQFYQAMTRPLPPVVEWRQYVPIPEAVKKPSQEK